MLHMGRCLLYLSIMAKLEWLDFGASNFPDPRQADSEGIVAIGGDLSVTTLLTAYSQGIFPWYNDQQPILWWSPDPRFVMHPSDIKVAKSMRSYFNKKKYRLSMDAAFEKVIFGCQQRMADQDSGGTWITADMYGAYVALHKAGYAHSVEVWDDEELVGGLYGVAIGKVFFGESMFTLKSNASKMAYIQLCKELLKRDYQLIDCQQETGHLGTLGAKAIPRNTFLDRLEQLVHETTDVGSWNNWLE